MRDAAQMVYIEAKARTFERLAKSYAQLDIRTALMSDWLLNRGKDSR